jgi:hypothetical protein
VIKSNFVNVNQLLTHSPDSVQARKWCVEACHPDECSTLLAPLSTVWRLTYSSIPWPVLNPFEDPPFEILWLSTQFIRLKHPSKIQYDVGVIFAKQLAGLADLTPLLFPRISLKHRVLWNGVKGAFLGIQHPVFESGKLPACPVYYQEVVRLFNPKIEAPKAAFIEEGLEAIWGDRLPQGIIPFGKTRADHWLRALCQKHKVAEQYEPGPQLIFGWKHQVKTYLARFQHQACQASQTLLRDILSSTQAGVQLNLIKSSDFAPLLMSLDMFFRLVEHHQKHPETIKYKTLTGITHAQQLALFFKHPDLAVSLMQKVGDEIGVKSVPYSSQNNSIADVEVWWNSYTHSLQGVIDSR